MHNPMHIVVHVYKNYSVKCTGTHIKSCSGAARFDNLVGHNLIMLTVLIEYLTIV